MLDTQIAAILLGASKKFGSVVGFTDKGESLKIAIKRSEPVFADREYMTITGHVYGIDSDGVFATDFYWGHYDLTKDQAITIINE